MSHVDNDPVVVSGPCLMAHPFDGSSIVEKLIFLKGGLVCSSELYPLSLHCQTFNVTLSAQIPPVSLKVIQNVVDVVDTLPERSSTSLLVDYITWNLKKCIAILLV